MNVQESSNKQPDPAKVKDDIHLAQQSASEDFIEVAVNTKEDGAHERHTVRVTLKGT